MTEKKNETIYVELLLDGKMKRYILPSHVPTRKLSRSIEIAKMMENDEIIPEHVPVYMEYLLDMFDNQFTADELDDGLNSSVFIKTVYATALHIIGRIADAMRLFTGEKETEEGDTKNEH